MFVITYCSTNKEIVGISYNDTQNDIIGFSITLLNPIGNSLGLTLKVKNRLITSTVDDIYDAVSSIDTNKEKQNFNINAMLSDGTYVEGTGSFLDYVFLNSFRSKVKYYAGDLSNDYLTEAANTNTNGTQTYSSSDADLDVLQSGTRLNLLPAATEIKDIIKKSDIQLIDFQRRLSVYLRQINDQGIKEITAFTLLGAASPANTNLNQFGILPEDTDPDYRTFIYNCELRFGANGIRTFYVIDATTGEERENTPFVPPTVIGASVQFSSDSGIFGTITVTLVGDGVFDISFTGPFIYYKFVLAMDGINSPLYLYNAFFSPIWAQVEGFTGWKNVTADQTMAAIGSYVLNTENVDITYAFNNS